MPNLVLIAEAVQALNYEYTARHITLLLRQGRVQGRKVGRIWLVNLDDLRQYKAEMDRLGTKKHDPTKGDKD